MSVAIDKVFFESVVASATEASGNVFASMQGYIETATEEIKQFLGEELYADIAGETFYGDYNYSLSLRVMRYICLRAYELAIPHLDLVLTPTGFGIVSNQNTAPASADRVARLQQSVKDAKEDAFDVLLDMLRGNEKWCERPNAVILFSSLFWSAHQLVRYGFSNPHRTRLREYRPKINKSESRIKELISPEFHQELCDSVRCKNSTPMQQSAITFCLNAIAYEDSTTHQRILLKFLNDNIDSFQTYARSTAYKANNFKPYENGLNDSCYFFG